MTPATAVVASSLVLLFLVHHTAAARATAAIAVAHDAAHARAPQGTPDWSIDVSSSSPVTLNSKGDGGAAPTVAFLTGYLPGDQEPRALAIHLSSGAIKWSVQLQSKGVWCYYSYSDTSAPAPLYMAGHELLVVASCAAPAFGVVNVLNANTGAVVWSSGTCNQAVVSLGYRNGMILATSSAGAVYAFKLNGDLVYSYSAYLIPAVIITTLPDGTAVVDTSCYYCGYMDHWTAISPNGTAMWTSGFATTNTLLSGNGDFIYAPTTCAGQMAGVGKLSAKTGATAWCVSSGAASAIGISPDSTTIVGAVVGQTTAYDAVSGSIVWNVTMPSATFIQYPQVSPPVYGLDGKAVVVAVSGGGATLNATIYGLDAATGALLWTASNVFPTVTYANDATIQVVPARGGNGEGDVFILACDGAPYALSISQQTGDIVEHLYTNSTSGTTTAAVYGKNALIVAYDAGGVNSLMHFLL